MDKNTNSNRGITLIALIITIVILLILAIVSIGSLQDSGIIDHAQNATSEFKVAQDNETKQLEYLKSTILETRKASES